jgi:hypothetical protein
MFYMEITTVFLLIFMMYYIFIIRKSKNYNEKKGMPEVLLLIKYFKLDIKKINYKKLVALVSLINSLIITITFGIVIFIKGILMQLLLAFFILIPLIIISYGLLGKYYQKKGMTKDV